METPEKGVGEQSRRSRKKRRRRSSREELRKERRKTSKEENEPRIEILKEQEDRKRKGSGRN